MGLTGRSGSVGLVPLEVNGFILRQKELPRAASLSYCSLAFRNAWRCLSRHRLQLRKRAIRLSFAGIGCDFCDAALSPRSL